MKKIPSLFKRNYDGDRLIYNELVEGCEWVTRGEGVATEKFDGTACLVHYGKLYKRYDRKLKDEVQRLVRRNPDYVPLETDFKPAPDGWFAAEAGPDVHTGHYPGWLPVDWNKPENQWHCEGWDYLLEKYLPDAGFTASLIPNGTYELVGPKIQGNPHCLERHLLWKHGSNDIPDVPTDFGDLRLWLLQYPCEGIVWHHPDGRMAKIKRRDYGLAWPPQRSAVETE